MVMEEASEELLLDTVEPNVVTRKASDDDTVVMVASVLVMDEANDELLLVMLLCSESMRVAADALFVVTAELRDEIEETKLLDAVW